MKKATVLFYRDDRHMNAALAKYISENNIVEANSISFFNDEYAFNFMFVGMCERDWDGWMSGIKTCTKSGDMVVFASWEDGEYEDEECRIRMEHQDEPDSGFEEVFMKFVSSL